MDDQFTAKTKYWHALADGRIQCDLCPRGCKLQEGQAGLCFVRVRKNDQVVLISYGRSSGFCLDPIEKKPLYHFLPGTSILSFGTAGCNLTCKFCQNWDMSKSRETHILAQRASPKQIAQAAKRAGARSVAFTYNEPVIFMEYAIDVAQECHALGVKTVAVTAGYICSEPRAEFFKYIDAANIDLKAFSERFYSENCSAHLQPILETLIYVKRRTQVWLEIAALIIPGENDSDDELEKLSAWIFEHLGPDVPLHFSAFHPAYQMVGIPPTPPQTLFRAREIGLKNGLRYVYTGNIRDSRGSTTFCHACGAKVVERDQYSIKSYSLSADGKCAHCAHRCAGVFDGPAGDWGARRESVELEDL